MRKTWIVAGALLVVAASAMNASAHGNKGGSRQGGMGMGPEGMGRGPGGIGRGMVKGARVGLGAQLGLNAEQQTQLEALKATYEEKEEALREEEQAAFKALLTAEQQAAIDAAATAGRGRHRGPAVRLTDEQQTHLGALRTEFQEKHQALHTEFQTAFEDLLTVEQKTKLAALRIAGPFGVCTGAGAEIPAAGTSSTGTTTSPSAAKVVGLEDGTGTPGEAASASWGQLKSAD